LVLRLEVPVARASETEAVDLVKVLLEGLLRGLVALFIAALLAVLGALIIGGAAYSALVAG